VNTLDLDIVHTVKGDIYTSICLDPLLKFLFVLALNVSKLLNEDRVLCVASEGLEHVQGTDPLINRSNGLTNEITEGSIAAVDPAARSNTISFVLNLSRVELVKFFE
jgi:hypothetical protein